MNTDDGNTRNPPSRKAVEKLMLDHAVANAEEIASLRAQLAAVEKERDELSQAADLLKAVAERAGKERDEARAMAYVPGLRECAKCGCTLVTTTIHVPSGNLSVDRKPKDCPNGCGPTWPVTERQAANAAIKREDAALLRANELAPRVAVAEAERDEAIDKAIDYMAACTKAETERDAATGALAAAVSALNRWRSFAGDNILDCDGHLICATEDSCPQKPACDESCLELRAALDATEPFIFKSPAADLAARHDAEVTRRALESLRHVVLVNDLTGHSWVLRQIDDRLAALATPTPEKPR